MNDEDETQYSNNQNNMRRDMRRSVDRQTTYLSEPDSFLYKNRWWIVLGLTLLLMYYLHSRSCMEQSTPEVIELNIGMMRGGAREAGFLDLLPKYSPVLNTEHRKLFGLQ